MRNEILVRTDNPINIKVNKVPEILLISSFPPRECGIATYSDDLLIALNKKFSQSFTINICPLESQTENHSYAKEIKYILNTDQPNSFTKLAKSINENADISIVMIQHEFGFFQNKEADLKLLIHSIHKPVIVAFHTVLPHPNENLKLHVQELSLLAESIIVMTNSSANIMTRDYGVAAEKITVIPHGTHLISHPGMEELKVKYKLTGKNVLTTFGLLSSGKSIETTLEALPAIIKINPDVHFLIIGKTHPNVVKQEGEKYRQMLEAKVAELKLQQHVKFINYFLPLPELLEYLQLTDIYLFTSKDPNQAVSGTFSYAISCGCPVISTPIPHALEVLRDDAGIIIEFENSHSLTNAVSRLLNNESLKNNMSSNGLHRMASTAWENAAISHAMLFENITLEHLNDTTKVRLDRISLKYNLPAINLDHINKLTTDFGIIQFSKINQPDIDSGYTLDDNARALIAMCQYYELAITSQGINLTDTEHVINNIKIYYRFIKYCLQAEGYFLNYVDEHQNFTAQNDSTNLADANGRAIWALGYLISMSHLLPKDVRSIGAEAELLMQDALINIPNIYSTRAMAFVIKGLYYSNKNNKSVPNMLLIKELANRLVQMYRHEATKEWNWYESYLTYANSILPEAMLCAWMATGEQVYKEIAKSSFDFLLSKTFVENKIKVISNKNWLQNIDQPSAIANGSNGGEQPIDVAYTILALSKFYHVFKEENYFQKLESSFSWFLGNNHLNQIIYNPCTGGCYDGLENDYVNLNQGAESTLSYLMARLTVEKLLVDKRIEKQLTQEVQKQNTQIHILE